MGYPNLSGGMGTFEKVHYLCSLFKEITEQFNKGDFFLRRTALVSTVDLNVVSPFCREGIIEIN